MQDLDRALSEIGEIRSRLAAGAMFGGFGPMVVAITGALALATASAQQAWPETFAADTETFLFYWVVTAGVCAALIGSEMFARTRRIHGGLGDAMLLNAAENFIPAGVAGAAICAVMLKYAPGSVWLLPGLWQVLVALGVFAAARTLPRAISLVAAWYFVAGIVALIVCARHEALSPWVMGLPFAVGQLLMASVLKFAQESDDDPA